MVLSNEDLEVKTHEKKHDPGCGFVWGSSPYKLQRTNVGSIEWHRHGEHFCSHKSLVKHIIWPSYSEVKSTDPNFA